LPRGDPTQPQCRQRTDGRREEHEDDQIAPAAIECELVGARRCAEYDAIAGESDRGAISDQRQGRADSRVPRRRDFVAEHEIGVHVGIEKAAER
jgi:hypothetical protein